MAPLPDESQQDFALVERISPGVHGYERTTRQRTLSVLQYLLATWLPLVILSGISGLLWPGIVKLPFFHDPEVQARFLFVLPLLELGKVIVGRSLVAQANQFLRVGLIPKEFVPRFQAVQAWAVAWRESKFILAVTLVLSVALAIYTRVALGFSAGSSSWERVSGMITPAGWWYMLVSLPVLYFMLLRWVWIFFLWGAFLFGVSRIPLNLTATHPDRSGGIGFLGWGLSSFSSVLMAVSAVVSAALAEEILHRGESIDSLKYHVIVFAISSMVILHAPLLAFSGQLSRCRFQGLLEFGKLVWEHDRDFEAKWIEKRPQESLLGSADVQTLASAATAYEHVDRMWLLPLDVKACVTLFLAILIPMIPLLGTAIPLNEIFMKLMELVI
ncbi:MAG: hypothetical protein U0894_14315 [Pirellulales bacterium]